MLLTWLVTLVTLTGATTETTDFDVYHPMRTLHYLVKTTMPGGGNFANKLAPGYVYVWNGVKPRCALKDMMDSMIYNEDAFKKKHLGKEKDPKPDLARLKAPIHQARVQQENLGDDQEDRLYQPLQVVTDDDQAQVRNNIIMRMRSGKDLCDYFTSDGNPMSPVDEVARVHLQSRIDAKTLMNPKNHFEQALNGAQRKEAKRNFPWFMNMVKKIDDKKEIRVHPELAKAYSHRRYVDRDCGTLLNLMPSYVDCIDGRLADTVMDANGQIKTGVKYDGDAPISKRYRGLHKMTRLKKEPVYMAVDSYHLNKDVRNEFVDPVKEIGSGYSDKSISKYRTFYWHNRTADGSNYDMNDRIDRGDRYRGGNGGKSLLQLKDDEPDIVGFDGRKVSRAGLSQQAPYYTELLRFQGIKTPILSPLFQGKLFNWQETGAMSSDLLPVRDWSPRNVKIATGALNPYWSGHKVNKNLYPVINMNGRPFWRSHATDSLYVSQAAFNWRLKTNAYTPNPSKAPWLWAEGQSGQPNAMKPIRGIEANRKVPKTNGSPDWLDRTSSGRKFVYAYSAGCWMKMAPHNYGYDVKLTEANYTKVGKDKWEIYSKQHKSRDKQSSLEPKYKYNKALDRWWNGEYGEQWYFSLKDAITQKRCNGDEMLWYLFYSRPSKMDEFCTNTNFGNTIPADFCKLNPPVYFNFTVTHKNNRQRENRGKPFSYRPDWHKEKFGEEFIFTGFASKNNPDVWMTASEREADFSQWCQDTGRDCGPNQKRSTDDTKTTSAAIPLTAPTYILLFLITLSIQ